MFDNSSPGGTGVVIRISPVRAARAVVLVDPAVFWDSVQPTRTTAGASIAINERKTIFLTYSSCQSPKSPESGNPGNWRSVIIDIIL